MKNNLLAAVGKIKIILLVLVLLIGCSKSGPEIIGVWDNAKAPETVEFRADGTGLFVSGNQQNPPLRCTWKQTSKINYLIEIDFQGSKKILMATVKGKAMNLESDVGNEMYNKRDGR